MQHSLTRSPVPYSNSAISCDNVVAVVSLALFAATAALVMSGYEGALHPFGWPDGPIARPRLAASAQDGRLYLGLMTPPADLRPTRRMRRGFGYLHTGAWTDASGRLVRVGTMRQVVAPAWAVLAVSAVAPAAWVARRVRRGRALRLGLCPRCGYDLRASPERCPECGAMDAARPAG